MENFFNIKKPKHDKKGDAATDDDGEDAVPISHYIPWVIITLIDNHLHICWQMNLTSLVLIKSNTTDQNTVTDFA